MTASDQDFLKFKSLQAPDLWWAPNCGPTLPASLGEGGPVGVCQPPETGEGRVGLWSSALRGCRGPLSPCSLAQLAVGRDHSEG